MASFLRRFVYLVVDGQKPCTLDLYRISMSRFFHPRSLPVEAAAIVDARLPRPTMTFYPPSSEHSNGIMHFMLMNRDKVLATDQMGRASIFDAGAHAMCTAPSFSRPKDRPVSITVGDKLYVLDTFHRVPCLGEKKHCFEALICEHGGPDSVDWRCHSLPTPPYRPAHIHGYAVVGGSELWVCTEGEEGTYSFDTERNSWAKQGDWTLPFCGLAEYVPEFKLWFGLSNKKDSNLFCAFDLAAAARRQCAPIARHVWEDLRPPKGWLQVRSYLAHLGSGRFCIARLFCDVKPCDMDDFPPWKTLAVFTAVEVVQNGNKGFRMIKHKSQCYNLGDDIINQWVL